MNTITETIKPFLRPMAWQMGAAPTAPAKLHGMIERQCACTICLGGTQPYAPSIKIETIHDLIAVISVLDLLVYPNEIGRASCRERVS